MRRRSGTRLCVLLACGAGALGLLATIAAATPSRRGESHRHSTRVGKCASRSRTRVGRSRRHARCRRSRHTRARHPSPTVGAPVTPPASSGSASPPDTSATGGAASPVAPLPGSGAQGEAPGSPGGPPSVPHVEVTAVEYSFTLSRTTVPAGRVILQFVNRGQDEHNLNAAPAEGEPVASVPNTRSGEVRQLSVELRRGSYTLFCSLPEHAKKGMRATLVVE